MRTRVLTGLTVVALCAWAAAAEPPAHFTSDDVLILIAAEPNDPNRRVPPPAPEPNDPWIPAEHLTATWQSIAVNMTSRLYNPAVMPHQAAKGPEWSLSLSSLLSVIDSNGLIGLSLSTTSGRALDQNGSVVSSTPATDMPSRWYSQPHYITMPTGPNGEWVTEMFPNIFSVSLPMVAGARYPSVLSRVEWSMYAVVSDKLQTVDVPFKAGDTWVELTPGLEILVDKAVAEAGKYQYSLKVRWNPAQADYLSGGSIHLWPDEKLPATIVLDMDILDTQERPVEGQGSGSFSSGGSFSGNDNLMTGTTSGTGNCGVCGDATTFRFTLALNPYEKELRFAVENVPVPEF